MSNKDTKKVMVGIAIEKYPLGSTLLKEEILSHLSAIDID